MEFEAKNTSEFEARMAEYQAEGAFRDKMKGYTELYVTGTREDLPDRLTRELPGGSWALGAGLGGAVRPVCTGRFLAIPHTIVR